MQATIILSLWTMNAIMGCIKVANSKVHEVNSDRIICVHLTYFSWPCVCNGISVKMFILVWNIRITK